MSNIAFIDFENATNTEQMDFSDIDEIIVFKGANQHQKAIKLTSFTGSIKTVNIDKIGKNNLDFHLVFKLGELHYKRSIDDAFSIFSGDKGFDDVIHQLCLQGRNAKRIDPHAQKHEVTCQKNCSGLTVHSNSIQQSKSDCTCLDLLKRIPASNLAKTLPKLSNQLANGIASMQPQQVQQELKWLEYHNLIAIEPSSQKVSYNLQ